MVADAPNLKPTLVIALDGATFDVIRPMIDAGELPHLAKWSASGVAEPLPSVTPPVTFPAWSSFMTGLPPGEHGIFDFSQKAPGEYRLRFVNATDRAGDSLFRRVSDAGGSALVLGLPATHPPEDISGLLVCGFDAPVSTGTDARSASDPDFYREIAGRVGPWMRPALNESAKASDFHERAISTLLDRIDRKKDFALDALASLRGRNAGALPAVTMIVFSESDTAGHHYWRDHDPDSPRHDPSASAARRDALRAVYRRLDEACGELRRAVGDDALCVVLSDHGMGGASDKVVHLNRYLAEVGLLARREGLGRFVDRMARWLRDTALAWLPASIAQQLFRRARAAAAELESRARFGGFDWSRTLAFSEEANTNPGIWINVKGRETYGIVAEEDYETVRERVLKDLEAWRLPSGQPVIARALRREDVHDGPFSERAPDIVIELALDDGYGLSLVPTPWADGGPGGAGIPSLRILDEADHAGGRGRGMNGTHRNNGIWIATGPGAQDREAPTRLDRVAPWLAAAMGLAWESEDSARTATRREAVTYDACRGSNGRRAITSPGISRMNQPALSLVFPAFNEAENLPVLLETALKTGDRLGLDFEIVVVDDGSEDSSRQILERWRHHDRRIRAVHHSANQGYGAALRSGLRAARGELVFFSDADLQFDLREIQMLLNHAGEFDIVAGYRAPRRDPWLRRGIAWLWGSLIERLFDLQVRDIDCAFKIFRRGVLDSIPIDSIGAFVNTEMLARARAAGFRIKQVPVTHRARALGRQTGAHPRVIARALIELTKLYSELHPRRGTRNVESSS